MDKVLSWYSTNVYRYHGQGSNLDLTFYRRVNHTYRPTDRSMNVEELKLNYGERIKVVNSKISITLRLREQIGEVAYLKLKRSTKSSELFNKYANSKG